MILDENPFKLRRLNRVGSYKVRRMTRSDMTRCFTLIHRQHSELAHMPASAGSSSSS